MTVQTIALTPAFSALAAALHATSGLHETWSAAAFQELLAMTGVRGLLARRKSALAAEGDPVGMILWRTAVDEAEILTICVRPDARRLGAARRLLGDAGAMMREAGVRRLFLEVATDNLAAIALYRGFGFQAEGRRRDYYRTQAGPVDALILAIDL